MSFVNSIVVRSEEGLNVHRRHYVNEPRDATRSVYARRRIFFPRYAGSATERVIISNPCENSRRRWLTSILCDLVCAITRFDD